MTLPQPNFPGLRTYTWEQVETDILEITRFGLKYHTLTAEAQAQGVERIRSLIPLLERWKFSLKTETSLSDALRIEANTHQYRSDIDEIPNDQIPYYFHYTLEVLRQLGTPYPSEVIPEIELDKKMGALLSLLYFLSKRKNKIHDLGQYNTIVVKGLKILLKETDDEIRSKNAAELGKTASNTFNLVNNGIMAGLPLGDRIAERLRQLILIFFAREDLMLLGMGSKIKTGLTRELDTYFGLDLPEDTYDHSTRPILQSLEISSSRGSVGAKIWFEMLSGGANPFILNSPQNQAER